MQLCGIIDILIQSCVIFNVMIDISRFYSRIFNTTRYLSFQFLWWNMLQKSSEVGTDKSRWVSRIPLRHFRSENWETSAYIRVCVTKTKRASCLYGFYSRGLSHWFPRMDGMLDYNNHILRNHGTINSILDSILITKDLLHSVTEFTFWTEFYFIEFVTYSYIGNQSDKTKKKK